VISLLYLGVERPREAMMLRAPETEALLGIALMQGFGVLGITLDGSPVPLGSTVANEPQGYPNLCGGGGSPRCHRIKTLWIRKHSNPKQMNASDNQ
jgi:hypothetical protein